METATAEMLADGIILESKFPFNSHIIAVPKTNRKLRPCNVYRLLNARVIPNWNPLPILGEIFQILKGTTVFPTLDCQSGFWQISWEESSNGETAFFTQTGHCDYSVLLWV